MFLLHQLLINRPNGKVKENYDPFTIYIINDLHMETDEGTYHDRMNNWEKWFWLINKINEDKPDLFIDLGDHISDYSGTENMDWSRYFEGWNSIDPSIPKLFIPGNHEARNYTHDDLVNVYKSIDSDIDKRPYNGSEKFNFMYEQSGVGFLFVSANYDEEGNQSNGYITDSTFDWIEEELNSTDKEFVIICSHYGAQRNHLGDFSQRLLKICNDALERNPNLKEINNIFGHTHVDKTIKYTNMSPLTGYLLSAGTNGYWDDTNVSADGFKPITIKLEDSTELNKLEQTAT